MSKQPEVALLVSTYQRPAHLRRVLLSIALQQQVAGKIEVAVTDDGSEDETADVVARFAADAPFPVHFTTHPHAGFQLARCRNEGARATTSPYLLFLDGDCVLPRCFVSTHLRRRRPGVAFSSDAVRLDRRTTELLTEDRIRQGDLLPLATRSEVRRLLASHRKAWWYSLIRHRCKPRLMGGGTGMWRADFERVNGYDENFVGWGCEDDDLRCRVGSIGVQARSIARWTFTLHQWHPPHATVPQKWRNGSNVDYFNRPGRLTRCVNGLVKRSLDDLQIRLSGDAHLPRARRLLPERLLRPRSASNDPSEVEVLMLSEPASFAGSAQCNVLFALKPASCHPRVLQQADYVASDRPIAGVDETRRLPLAPLDDVLAQALQLRGTPAEQNDRRAA